MPSHPIKRPEMASPFIHHISKQAWSNCFPQAQSLKAMQGNGIFSPNSDTENFF